MALRGSGRHLPIWLEGEHIGAQLQALEVMWNRPFMIDFDTLPTARVVKEHHCAGIWQPVGLMERLFACVR